MSSVFFDIFLGLYCIIKCNTKMHKKKQSKSVSFTKYKVFPPAKKGYYEIGAVKKMEKMKPVLLL